MPHKAHEIELRRYVRSLQAVAGCVTAARFVVTPDAPQQHERSYRLVLTRGEGVHLRANGGAVLLTVGQRFRIVLYPDSGPFVANIMEYWYSMTTAGGSEIIAWRWTPDVIDPAQRRWLHLHVGHAVLGGGGTYLPGSFGRLHVPTAQVPFASVVRFAVEELGVAPIRGDWQAVLSAYRDIA